MKELFAEAIASYESVRDTTLQVLLSFTETVAEYLRLNGEFALTDIVSKAISNACFACFQCFTVDGFMGLCKESVKHILRKAANISVESKDLIVEALKETASGIKALCSDRIVGQVFGTIVERAAEEIAEEGGRVITAAKHTLEAGSIGARAAAKSAFVVSAFFEGALFAGTAATSAYQYHKGEIPGEIARRRLVKRGSSAAGSISMTTAGAAVGTMLLPGVGTFIGGFVGGFLGEWGGARVGEAIDDRLG